MTQPRRLLFVADIGGDGAAHVGDEAMLDANLGLFRSVVPHAELIVAAGEGSAARCLDQADAVVPRLCFPAARRADLSELDRQLSQIVASASSAELPAIAALRSADLLIVSGGGNLDARWPHLIYERAAMVKAAALHSIPVMFLGQTIGPDLAGRTRDVVTDMLRAAVWVGVREAPSYALALALGVKADRLSFQLDDAVWLPPEPCDLPWTQDLRDARERPWIAVTMHPFCAPASDDRTLVKLADELRRIAAGCRAKLVFLPHVDVSASAGIGDAQFGAALSAAIGPQVGMRVGTVLPPRQMLWLTQRASMVVTSRYHPVVFALAAGVACVGLSTDRYTRVKLAGAFGHAGRDSDVMPIEAALDGALSAYAIGLWRERARIAQALAQARESWLQLHDERLGNLSAAIEGAWARIPGCRRPMSERACSHLTKALADALQAETKANASSVLAMQLQAVEAERQSLEAHARALEFSQREAERYAKSLEKHCHGLEARIAALERPHARGRKAD